MLNKTLTALAAIGIAATLSLAPTAPAQAALFVDCSDPRNAHVERCIRKAERKARWNAFWNDLLGKRDRRADARR